jgi:hypothetical protein
LSPSDPKILLSNQFVWSFVYTSPHKVKCQILRGEDQITIKKFHDVGMIVPSVLDYQFYSVHKSSETSLNLSWDVWRSDSLVYLSKS